MSTPELLPTVSVKEVSGSPLKLVLTQLCIRIPLSPASYLYTLPEKFSVLFRLLRVKSFVCVPMSPCGVPSINHDTSDPTPSTRITCLVLGTAGLVDTTLGNPAKLFLNSQYPVLARRYRKLLSLKLRTRWLLVSGTSTSVSYTHLTLPTRDDV